MNRIDLLLPLLLISLWTGCGESAPPPLLPPIGIPTCDSSQVFFPEKIAYQHPQAPFSFQYPPNWNLQEDPSGIYGVVLSDSTAGLEEYGIVSITLAQGTEKRLKPYFQASLKEFLAIGDYEMVQSGEDRIGPYQALAFFGYSKKNQELLGYHRNIFYIIQVSGTVYLHVQIEAYGEKQLDRKLCRLKEIVNTLQI